MIEEADSTRTQEDALARRFATQYHLITRDDRLDKIADDLVRHFVGRGFRGKAMFVAIDKATAVRMYDKVQPHWTEMLARETRARRRATADPIERAAMSRSAGFMEETDMAVVVSQSQNEIAD